MTKDSLVSKNTALKLAIDCLEYHYNNGAWGMDIEGTMLSCKEALAHKSLGDFKSYSKEECVDYIECLRKEIDLLRFKEQPEQEQPQKQWVGLSDADVMQISWGLDEIKDIDIFKSEFARFIEAKLKELNT